MISVIQTTVTVVFIFAVLVMFHEFGHYIAARLTGMRVEEFAFGFGPRILTLFKRGDTEYTVHAFPLGGFVKITGMEPGEENIPDGFQAQSVLKRALVIFSGPFASFLLAVLVFLGMGLFWGYPIGNTTNRIAVVMPKTEAARAGLRAGDRILSVDGQKTSTGIDMVDTIHANAGRQINLVVVRNGGRQTITVTPKWRVEYLGASWSFMKSNRPTIDQITKGYPADTAKLQPNDVLASIDGKRITNATDMLAAIKAAEGRKVSLTVERAKKTESVNATPVFQAVDFQGIRWEFPNSPLTVNDKASLLKSEDVLIKINGQTVESGNQFVEKITKAVGKQLPITIYRNDELKQIKLNVTPADVKSIKTEFYQAYGVLGFQPDRAMVTFGVMESLDRGLHITANFVSMLLNALRPDKIKDNIGGPIMIVKAAQVSAARGLYDVFELLGGLSMSLAFINMLPIPIVDGGHLMLLAVEAVRRKRLTPQQMQVFQMIGLVILGALIIFVMSSDLFKLTQGQVPQ